MNQIETIQNDCRRATFLIEKKQVQPITRLEEFQLWVHLRGCSICRTFQIQSVLINQVAKALFRTPRRQGRLDEYAKHQMRQIINEKISDD